MDPPEVCTSWRGWLVILRKNLVYPAPKLIQTEREKQQALAWPSGLGPALAWCFYLFSPWAMGGLSSHMAHGFQEGIYFSLSCQPGKTWAGAFMCSLLGACSLVDFAAACPAASRRDPEMGSSQEQPKLPGWPLSSCLWGPKDVTLKWSRNTGHWLALVLVSLSTVGLCLGFVEEMSFQTGSLPFSQAVQHLNKTFLFHHQLPPKFCFFYLVTVLLHMEFSNLHSSSHSALPGISVLKRESAE